MTGKLRPAEQSARLLFRVAMGRLTDEFERSRDHDFLRHTPGSFVLGHDGIAASGGAVQCSQQILARTRPQTLGREGGGHGFSTKPAYRKHVADEYRTRTAAPRMAPPGRPRSGGAFLSHFVNGGSRQRRSQSIPWRVMIIMHSRRRGPHALCFDHRDVALVYTSSERGN